MSTLQARTNRYLTNQETKAIVHVANGLSNHEIGERLGICERTAKYHVENAMHKLDADNRTHMVTEAFHHRILEFLVLVLVLHSGLMLPTAAEKENPLRPRSGGTRRTQMHMRFTRSVQIRINRNGIA